MDITEKAKKVKLLLLDIDGVMTDGKLHYTNNGDEFKSFDVTDGLGIVIAQRKGLKCAILTAKQSNIVTKRAADLGIEKVYQGYHFKIEVLEDIKKTFKVSEEEICFVGDDIIDISVLKVVGFAVAVKNAREEVRAVADHITQAEGGNGAVREVCEVILKTQGKWEEVLDVYSKNNK
ncbi:MAG: HAD hydrolase family protein [Candidatus Omnitrophica bacterium]|nr:HAD hydrolase family protein [Candidatus Omnitrophota bacterium]